MLNINCSPIPLLSLALENSRCLHNSYLTVCDFWILAVNKCICFPFPSFLLFAEKTGINIINAWFDFLLCLFGVQLGQNILIRFRA